MCQSIRDYDSNDHQGKSNRYNDYNLQARGTLHLRMACSSNCDSSIYLSKGCRASQGLGSWEHHRSLPFPKPFPEELQEDNEDERSPCYTTLRPQC
jgi:hypothetical protein